MITQIKNISQMMLRFKFCWFVLLLTSLLTSCERNIDLDLPDVEQQLVIEGYVYEGQNPYLLLTRSSAFFSVIDSSVIANYVVRGAKITVSDGTVSDTMVEIPIGQVSVYFCIGKKLIY